MLWTCRCDDKQQMHYLCPQKPRNHDHHCGENVTLPYSGSCAIGSNVCFGGSEGRWVRRLLSCCCSKPRCSCFSQVFFRVATCQGKVREKQNFLQVRELSGNFEKMSGNFSHLTNVREMSGNFVMTIKFF